MSLLKSDFNPANFKKSLSDDAPLIAAQIAAGEAECWRCGECHFVTRIEQSSSGLELCVVAAEGRGVVDGCKAIIAAAKAAGVGFVRYHTKSPALNRYMRRNGIILHRLETVYGMAIDGQ